VKKGQLLKGAVVQKRVKNHWFKDFDSVIIICGKTFELTIEWSQLEKSKSCLRHQLRLPGTIMFIRAGNYIPPQPT